MTIEFTNSNSASEAVAAGLEYLFDNKGYMSECAYVKVLKVVPGTALEVVPLNIDEKGEISVFLLQRSSDDPIEGWRHKWHCPGTMIRSVDGNDRHSLEKPWMRLTKEEIEKKGLSKLIDVETIELDTERGLETARIHILQIPMTLEGGRYINLMDLDSVRNEIVDHHLVIIGEAARNLAGLILSGQLTVQDEITKDFQKNMIASAMSSLKYLHVK